MLRLRGGAKIKKAMKGGSKVSKGKKGKGIKETDKERDLRLEIERLKEEEAARAKEEMRKRMLRERQAQEEAYSRVNRLKIMNQWRKLMRLVKVEDLRKEIEIISQNHEREVDRKDAIIQMLDRDLEEAEDQFQMALRAHLQNMDELIDLQDTRLLTLEQEFETELNTLETEFQAEKEMIVKQHALESQELSDIMAAVDAEEQEREAEAKQEHEQMREEIRNKNLEEINMLRIGLDSQIEDLEQHFETAHLNYLQTTDQRTSDFKYYTKKDQELSKEIEVKIRKIERLQSSLHHWRTKFAQNVKECSQRNQLLTEEKNKIQAHFQQLKARMNKFRSSQARRLSSLTQNANASKGELTEKIGLSERILRLAELGRKMETEQEKVMPFYVSSMSAEVDEAAAQMAPPSADGAEKEAAADAAAPTPLQSAVEDKDGSAVPKWASLDNFMKKFNKVLLDKLAIERERERLQRENNDLQAILKQYFDGVSVNDAVMKSSNPLFVVNGRVNLNQPLPVRRADQPLTVIDGNHMVATDRVNSVYPL